jgi:hypothetical protein
LGALEEAVEERVFLNRVVITEDTWEQPPNHIEEHQGGEFPPREDIIANRYLGVHIRLHPRIYTAVSPTDKE